MSDDPRSPGLDSLLALFGESMSARMRTSLPGEITAYDSDTQKASVRALVKDGHVDASERRIAKSIPEIHSVPVMFLGPPRARITWPVRVGDLCLILFSSSAIARWLEVGGEVDPGDDRHHDINDAIAVVGLHNFDDVPTEAPTDAIVFHCDGVKVKLGGQSGTSPIVVQSALDDFMDALTLAIATPDASGALSLLKAQLDLLNAGTGWKARTSTSEAK